MTPHPKTINPRELDRLFSGELQGFEKWFQERQRRNGVVAPAPLIGAERGVVKAYILYAATDRED